MTTYQEPQTLRLLEIARAIWQGAGEVTKKSLAERLDISVSSISRLTDELERMGVVVEVGTHPSSGGRRPAVLGINASLGYTIGLDIGGANARGIAADLNHQVISTVRMPTAQALESPDNLLNLERMVRRTIHAGGLEPHLLHAIGVAISGVIDTGAGICRFCPNIRGFNDLQVRDYLQDRFGVPVIVDDSVRTAAVAEHKFGLAKDMPYFLRVAVGVGIGAAIMLNGQIYRGVDGTAGELGHIQVREDGERCNCGNRGCLEVLASGPAIVRRAQQSMAEGIQTSLETLVKRGQKLTVEAIAQAARQGDKMAFYIMNRTGEYLGIAIATALNLLGVQDVIIGGGVSQAGPILLDAVERTIRFRVMPALAPKVRVHATALDDLAAARGAAWLAAEQLFLPQALDRQQSILDIADRIQPAHSAPQQPQLLKGA